jgi:plastocyanin
MLLLGVALASSPAHAQDVTVGVAKDAQQNPKDGNWVFTPATVTINVGDTVTWRNNSQMPHTSTSNDDVWDSGNLAPGQSFSFTFKEAGTFGYYCAYHEGQVGKVIVRAAGDDNNGQDDSGNDQSGNDQQGEDQGGGSQSGGQHHGSQGAMPDHAPSTGAGGMAGGGIPVVGNIAATLSLLVAGGYVALRRR